MKSDNVFAGDVHELLSFSNILATVDDKQWDVEDDVLELFDGFGELSDGCELIATLRKWKIKEKFDMKNKKFMKSLIKFSPAKVQQDR